MASALLSLRRYGVFAANSSAFSIQYTLYLARSPSPLLGHTNLFRGQHIARLKGIQEHPTRTAKIRPCGAQRGQPVPYYDLLSGDFSRSKAEGLLLQKAYFLGLLDNETAVVFQQFIQLLAERNAR